MNGSNEQSSVAQQQGTDTSILSIDELTVRRIQSSDAELMAHYGNNKKIWLVMSHTFRASNVVPMCEQVFSAHKLTQQIHMPSMTGTTSST